MEFIYNAYKNKNKSPFFLPSRSVLFGAWDDELSGWRSQLWTWLVSYGCNDLLSTYFWPSGSVLFYLLITVLPLVILVFSKSSLPLSLLCQSTLFFQFPSHPSLSSFFSFGFLPYTSLFSSVLHLSLSLSPPPPLILPLHLCERRSVTQLYWDYWGLGCTKTVFKPLCYFSETGLDTQSHLPSAVCTWDCVYIQYVHIQSFCVCMFTACVLCHLNTNPIQMSSEPKSGGGQNF